MEIGKNTLEQKLSHGQELAKQLQAQLINSQSLELCKSLAEEILAIFEKSISMANGINSTSPHSLLDSPQSEISQQPFQRTGKEAVSKKRKTQQKSRNLVKLGTGPEAQGPLEDGHSWRKYGQKEILGAIHPRSYFRCTHRNSQSCPAVKQVQRTDYNPSLFEVTYRGTHSCNRSTLVSPPVTPTPSYPSITYSDNTDFLINFKANLTVKTEDLDKKFQEPDFSQFASTSTLNDNFQFISPDSNYFSASPFSSEYFFEAHSSASTSPSPMLDVGFSLDNVEDWELWLDDSSLMDYST